MSLAQVGIFLSLAGALLGPVAEAGTETSITRKIYIPLDSKHFCFRRFNATHQFGCASPESGSSGVVKELRNDFYQEDLEFIIARGPDAPYVVLLDTDLFRLSTLQALSRSGRRRVAGVVVLDDQTTQRHLKGHSADRSCPNEYFSLYANSTQYGHCKMQRWNVGSKVDIEDEVDMLFHDYPFPMFMLRNQTDIDLLKNKTKEFGAEVWPKLAIELRSPMNGAKDAQTCIRRSLEHSVLGVETYCDHMGGVNLYHHNIDLGRPGAIANNSVVMLSGRLDSFSMFDGISPGADSAASSLVVLLATMEVLSRPEVRRAWPGQPTRSLLFAFFDGEAFDYMGSSFAAEQMAESRFPLSRKLNFDASDSEHTKEKNEKHLNLAHLSHLLELDQVAHYRTLRSTLENTFREEEMHNLYLHRHLDGNQLTSLMANMIINEVAKLRPSHLEMHQVSPPRALPPASVQSFLKLRNDADLGTLVITNHEREYVNRFYNGMFEDAGNFGDQQAGYWTELSTVLARVAAQLAAAGDHKVDDALLQANKTFVKELMTCFYNTSSCPLFRVVLPPSVTDAIKANQEAPPFPTYVGVFDSPKTKPLRNHLYLLMAFITGERVPEIATEEQCKAKGELEKDKAGRYHWMNGWSMKGECIHSMAYYDNSHSPAFDADTRAVNAAKLGRYALWAESQWGEAELRMFLVASRLQQWLTFVFALLVFSFSLAIVYYFSANSHLYFDLDGRDSLNASFEVAGESFDIDGSGGGGGGDDNVATQTAECVPITTSLSAPGLSMTDNDNNVHGHHGPEHGRSSLSHQQHHNAIYYR